MRVLLLSDIHSNVEALEACLASAPAHELVVNLGDLVGYGASPNQVIARSSELGTIFVRGNHDKAVCGLMDLKDFNPVAAVAARWTRNQLSPQDLDWLRALPQGPVPIDGIPDVQLVHGSPTNEDSYLVSARDALEPILLTTVGITFFGHTHLQGSFIANDEYVDAYRPSYETVGQRENLEVPVTEGLRYLVNPGSVGQPRDGDWRAAFALFDSDARTLTYCRVPYNLKSAQDRIVGAHLPLRLATRLAAGR